VHANGNDAFVPLSEVSEVWEVPGGHGRG
jgi:hypothetical protein